MDVAEVLRDIAREVEPLKPGVRVFEIEAKHIREAITKLKQSYREKGVFVSTIIAVDKPEEKRIYLYYQVHILDIGKTIALRTHVDRDNPRIATIIDLAPSAYVAELEIYDMFGVVFEGNTTLRRGFLVPEEIVAKNIYPLRKDSGV